MDKELRELAELTGELLGTLEGLWSECRQGALNKARRIADEVQGRDL